MTIDIIDTGDVRNVVNAIDATDVTSGKYSLMGEMTDADGKAYERFLREGPQEGLTQTEIMGISKADAQIALNMVDGDKVVRVSSIEGTCNTITTIDYSYKFERELVNFNDGYEIKTTVDKDLILVQYSSDAPDASLCYWITVDEANKIITLNDYMDKLALSKDWGNRNTVKVARISAGTKVKYAEGTAKQQLLLADPRPGGGAQYLFNQFDTDWITEVRSFSN